MTKEEKNFVRSCFIEHFLFMDLRDIETLFSTMREEIYKDIEETADNDFHSGDVSIAIRRVLFKKLQICS